MQRKIVKFPSPVLKKKAKAVKRVTAEIVKLIDDIHNHMPQKTIDKLIINGVVIDVSIYTEEEETAPIYSLSVLNISETTKLLLNKIRDEFVSKVSLSAKEAKEEEEFNLLVCFEN